VRGTVHGRPLTPPPPLAAANNNRATNSKGVLDDDDEDPPTREASSSKSYNPHDDEPPPRLMSNPESAVAGAVAAVLVVTLGSHATPRRGTPPPPLRTVRVPLTPPGELVRVVVQCPAGLTARRSSRSSMRAARGGSCPRRASLGEHLRAHLLRARCRIEGRGMRPMRRRGLWRACKPNTCDTCESMRESADRQKEGDPYLYLRQY
jgi:hypothetical protein